ncbi:MAG: exonuclease domain-containing protein, partial [Clostridia bacterium]|nr:exonuclease domain-containing protein [Clostridia bacterium]
MLDILVARLNNKFEKEFSYLKTYEISYFANSSVCNITFLYPQGIATIKPEQKQKITQFLIEDLKLNAAINVKFKKSYVDKNLVSKCFLEILKKYFSSLASLTSQEEIDIEIQNKIKNDDNNQCYQLLYVSVKTHISDKFLKNLNQDEIKLKLKNIIEKKFCAEFEFFFEKGKDLDEKKIEIQQKNELIKKLSDVKVTPRYEVFETVKVFGQQIEPFPEFMENIKENKLSVILAGNIENINKKSYKRTKNGEEVEKFYYSLFLKESGSVKKINCIYFCPKSNISKMDKLKEGDSILIVANIKKQNNYITAYIKSLSWCEIPKKIEIQNVPREEPTKFSTVFPERIFNPTQKNLFDIKEAYSENIKTNKFVVFDVETTGLDSENCELIEIGAVKVENGIFTEKFQTLIKPKNRISEFITEINGITNEMTENSPPAEEVIKDFYVFCKGAVLAGYNVGFDMKFIEKTANKVGLKFENDVQDVMLLAQQNIHIKNYKLKSVVKSLGISLIDA